MSRLPRLLPALLLTGFALAAALPLAGQDAKPKKYGVLVGVNRYQHDKLPDLKYAENDVAALAGLLKDADYQVTLLTGAAGARDKKHEPTKSNIEARLKEVLDKYRRGDTLLVALAGHGLHFEGHKDSFFCPADAKPFKDKTDTLVSLTKLYAELERSFAGVKLLLVDACRDDPGAGRGTRGVDGDVAPRPPTGVGALFSCSKGQRAYEHDDLKHGVFFHYVLQGLRGKAKDPDDGDVTFEALANYVKKQVTRDVPKRIGGGARQAPTLNAGELSGEPAVLLTVKDVARKPDPDETKLEDRKSFTNKAGMTMVRIAAGKFTMGSPKDEKGRGDDEHQHDVKITKAFYMAAHTVTVGQFRKFVEDENYKTDAEKDGQGGYGYNADTKKTEGRKSKYTWDNTGWKQTDRHPVVNVSWNDAVAYCKWLSKKEGKTYRLPTEAQWEYACRAGTTTRFYCGDDDADLRGHANIADVSFRSNLPEYKWGVDWDDGYAFTARVGSFKANPWRLYDMHGNVWQWCRDCYDKEFYKESDKEDPECNKGDRRVMRGGSWLNNARDCRAANRYGLAPACRDGDVGFRVVFAPAARTP
jgi:formylglycine-generating enzyme required for sulfatase activity